ncbi:hypothetical protein D3C76_996800 [compost metagenome]
MERDPPYARYRARRGTHTPIARLHYSGSNPGQRRSRGRTILMNGPADSGRCLTKTPLRSRCSGSVTPDATLLVLDATSPALVATHPVGDGFFLLHDRFRIDKKGARSSVVPLTKNSVHRSRQWMRWNSRPAEEFAHERSQVLAAGNVPLRIRGGPGRRTRVVRYGALLRCRLDRHHGDHGHHPPGPGVAWLQDQDEHAVGAGDLQVAGQQGPRRVPRQLDAEHGQRHQSLRRRRHCRDGARQPRRRQVHPRRSAARV